MDELSEEPCTSDAEVNVRRTRRSRWLGNSRESQCLAKSGTPFLNLTSTFEQPQRVPKAVMRDEKHDGSFSN